MGNDFLDEIHRPWRSLRFFPPSSVKWPGELPDEDSPPWVCLSKPDTPVVMRSYVLDSRTCDVIADHGRWLLESAVVPRVPQWPEDLLYGWDVAVGDVQPDWCIVYVGNELWFPQRVLRVDVLSETWQRVWSLGDVSTREVWFHDHRERDIGLVTNWPYDEISWPRWDDGPWYPLQSEPLSDRTRRFVLGKFDIPADCPECGSFGKQIVYGLPGLSTPTYVKLGGCAVTPGLQPTFACDCGFEWSVGAQGNVLPGGAAFEHDGVESGDLNYDEDDASPYGEAVEWKFQDLQHALLQEAGERQSVPRDKYGYPDYTEELYVHFLGQFAYDTAMEDLHEWRRAMGQGPDFDGPSQVTS